MTDWELAAKNDAAIAEEIRELDHEHAIKCALRMTKAYDDLLRRCEDFIDSQDAASFKALCREAHYFA